MKIKEKIKNNLDKLDVHELSVLSAMIDQMLAHETTKKRKPFGSHPKPYKKAREILQHTSLSSSDIIEGRDDRL